MKTRTILWAMLAVALVTIAVGSVARADLVNIGGRDWEVIPDVAGGTTYVTGADSLTLTGNWAQYIYAYTDVSLEAGSTIEFDYQLTKEWRNDSDWIGDAGWLLMDNMTNWTQAQRGLYFNDINLFYDYLYNDSAEVAAGLDTVHVTFEFPTPTTYEMTLDNGTQNHTFANTFGSGMSASDVGVFQFNMWDSQQDTTVSNFLVTAPQKLTWDGTSPGNWGDAHWTGAHPPDFPVHDETYKVGAIIDTPGVEVTVADDRSAQSLTLAGAQVIIGTDNTLAITGELTADTGTMVLQENATLAVGGGSLQILTTGDNGAISVDGNLNIATVTTGAGTFTKQGAGTASVTNLLAAGATLRVEGGTLASVGTDLLGGAVAIDLAGGTLSTAAPEAGNVVGFSDLFNPLVVDTSDLLPTDYSTGLPLGVTATWSGEMWFTQAAWMGDTNPTEYINLFSNISTGGVTFSEPVVVAEVRKYWTSWGDVGDWLVTGKLGGKVQWTANLADSQDAWAQGVLGPAQLVDELSFEGALWNHFDNLRFLASASEGAVNLSSVPVAVSGNSGLSIGSFSTATVGPLTMAQGAVLTTGGSGGLYFDGDGAADTTIAAGATDVGFNTQIRTYPGQIDANSAPVTITKSGPSDLIIDQPGVGLQDAAFNVQEGRLIGVHGSNPFAEADLQLGGGELVLAGATTGVDVQYDNAVSVTADSTLTAGAGLVGADGPIAVTVTSGIALGANTLTLQTTDDYTLNLPGTIDGPDGGVTVAQSTVNLTGMGNQIGTLTISGGAINTGADPVTISNMMTLDDLEFTIDAGNTFTVRSADVYSEAVTRELTLTGGTLSIGRPDTFLVYEEPFDYAGAAVWELGEVGWVSGVYSGGGGDDGLWDTTGDGAADAVWDWHAVADQHAIYTAPEEFPDVDLNQLSYIGFEYGAQTNGYSGTAVDTGLIVEVDGVWYISKTINTTTLVSGQPFDQYALTFDPDMNQWDTLDIATSMRGVTAAADLTGLITNVGLWSQTSVSETAHYDGLRIIGGNPAQLALVNTNLLVTETSVLAASSPDDAVFGDLTLAQDVTLTVEEAGALSVNNISLGDGSRLESNLYVRGTLDVGNSAGTATVYGSLEFDEGEEGVPSEAAFHVDIAGNRNDKIVIEGSAVPPYVVGSAWIAGSLLVDGLAPMTDAAEAATWGDKALTIMTADAESEFDIRGEFGLDGTTIPLSYGVAGALPNEGDYLGAGMWFGNATDDPVDKKGVYYVGRRPGSTDPNDPAEAVQIGVFQAAPGDTDGNRKVEGQDILNILQAGLFGDGVTLEANWGNGDFNADSKISGEDILALLGTGLFGDGTYPDSAAAAAAAADVKLVVTGDGLVIDTDGATVTGFVLSSESGILTGDDADNLGLFQEDTDATISGTFAMSLTGEHGLGDVIGQTDVDLGGDLSLAYTIAGVPGVFTASVVVPEPGMLALLAGSLAGLCLWRRRRA